MTDEQQQIEQEMDEYVEESDRILELKSTISRLTTQLRKARVSKEDLVAAVYQAARDNVLAIDIAPVPPYTPDPRSHGEEVAVAVIGDWQLAKVTPDYNSLVCEERIERYADKVLKLIDIQRADHPVEKLRLWGLGDLVEGEMIFPGQEHLIDASLYEQVCNSGARILGNLIRRLEAAVRELEVELVPGNHGAIGGPVRRSYNPESNADRMLYRITQLVAEAGGSKARFSIPAARNERSWYHVSDIGGYKTLLFHGDQIRGGFGGFPWYGFGKKLQGWKNGAIPGGFHDSFCFTKGTLITCRDGLKDIADVRVGDEVLTHEKRFRKVYDTQRRTVSTTVTLKGQGHPGLVTTDGHPFFAGDVPKRSDQTRDWDAWTPTWIRARDLEGKFWASPRSFPYSEIPDLMYLNGREKQVEFSPELMWIIGRWVGDGFFGGTDRLLICSAHHETDEVTAGFARAGLKLRTYETRTTMVHETCSTGLVRFITEHFGKGAGSKTISTWALGLPEDYRRALLDGYLSADGHTPREGRFEANTISKSLALGIKLLAQSLGYSTTLFYEDRAPTCMIEGRTCNQKPRWTVKGITEFDRFSGGAFVDDHLIGRVKWVDLTGPAEVYNISVEEDESYLADGLVVHNCGHWHQPTRFTLNTITHRVVGSTESYNTFAQEALAAVGRASQHLQFVKPGVGVTAEYVVYLDDTYNGVPIKIDQQPDPSIIDFLARLTPAQRDAIVEIAGRSAA